MSVGAVDQNVELHPDILNTPALNGLRGSQLFLSATGASGTPLQLCRKEARSRNTRFESPRIIQRQTAKANVEPKPGDAPLRHTGANIGQQASRQAWQRAMRSDLCPRQWARLNVCHQSMHRIGSRAASGQRQGHERMYRRPQRIQPLGGASTLS